MLGFGSFESTRRFCSAFDQLRQYFRVRLARRRTRLARRAAAPVPSALAPRRRGHDGPGRRPARRCLLPDLARLRSDRPINVRCDTVLGASHLGAKSEHELPAVRPRRPGTASCSCLHLRGGTLSRAQARGTETARWWHQNGLWASPAELTPEHTHSGLPPHNPTTGSHS